MTESTSDTLKVAVAQLNLTVGDVAGNVARIVAAAHAARDRYGCELAVFPELALTGYPPEDLLLRPAFLRCARDGLERVADAVDGIGVLLGLPLAEDGALYNAAAFLDRGRVIGTYRKQRLPNYSVFDERRYFDAGCAPCVVDFRGVRFGVTICEDIWWAGPVEESVAAGAQVVINLNASPFHIGRDEERFKIVADRARRNRVPVIYAHMVGGQDELVFDGASFVVDRDGALTQRARHFEEDTMVCRLALKPYPAPASAGIDSLQSVEEEVYRALTCGVRDYVGKNGFDGAVVGLSGGIDSALTLTIAADALGPQAIQAVSMPSRYTAPMSVDDARDQADTLGVAFHEISIEPMFEAFLEQLKPVFADAPRDATEENLQARCRGMVLMAISNKSGSIVLTTGNKSEMAVGYATLYGDMAGGFAVIKDVSKTLVYRLARYRNAISAAIPQRVLTRAPSAELAPDQKDEDTLPPYDVLDPILELYIEQDRSPAEIVAQGFAPDVVERVAQLVDRNEYKRRQAAPGVRITRRAFGRDRRYPITSGFRSRVGNR